jgi:molybdopterin-guanine dinucleotide biosynthesis protein A
MFWDAHILAGGQARRLGGHDKGALVVGDRRILERQLAALHGRAARIVVVGGPERHIGGGVEVIPDRLPGLGALGGLYTALVSATWERTLVLACDMPFVTGPFLEYLATSGGAFDATVPRDRHGLHPLCAVYARSVAPTIRRSIDQGVRRIREAIDPLRIHVIEGPALEAFDPEGRLLENINTPDDYARVLHG